MNRIVCFAQAVQNGHQEMSEAGEMGITYLFVVIGHSCRWLWQVLEVVANGGELYFGSTLAIAARVILSLIAGLVIIAALWSTKFKPASRPFRFALAFVAGFTAEAFIGPPVGALTSTALLAIG